MEHTSATPTDYKVAALNANILAMPIPFWKICCFTLKDRSFPRSSPYKTPVQDTQDHVPDYERSNCTVTGKAVKINKSGK